LARSEGIGGGERQSKAALGRTLTAHVIFVRYVLFAILAGLANLASQEAVVRLFPLWPVAASILVGTGVGFFAKYALDKKWVFLDGYDSHAAELRKILVYGLSGVATTALFWATELGFWHMLGTSQGKYLGAVIGLALGNWIKYLLDRHYVFPRSSS
jgi:putative flippase GtrA